MRYSKAMPWLAAVFRTREARGVALQIAAAILIGGTLYYLAANTADSLRRLGIASGFGFLGSVAGYSVGESFIEHSARSTVGRIFLVGLLNTLYVSAVGIVLATVLGVLVGIARVSSNWLAARLSAIYIEVFRNTPLLLQIAFWYALVRSLPPPRQALHPVPGVFISNRGLVHPLPQLDFSHGGVLAVMAASAVLAFFYWRRAARRKRGLGGRPRIALPVAGILLLPASAAWLLSGAPIGWSVPALRGFNFVGGTTHTPEFVALLTGIVTYIAAFIGEIVRAGIQAVGTGQREAARSLGIREHHILRYVTLPQALRVMVPPLTSQYLNLVKDSSLAVWIGYPDLVNVTNTTINQSGQALECTVIMMAVYLSISLAISAFMNWYNRRVALRGG
jgi:general L-amino acid transport system permease protein